MLKATPLFRRAAFKAKTPTPSASPKLRPALPFFPPFTIFLSSN